MQGDKRVRNQREDSGYSQETHCHGPCVDALSPMLGKRIVRADISMTLESTLRKYDCIFSLMVLVIAFY